MINVGITGKNGFVGSHLVNVLRQSRDIFNIIKFEREYFKDPFELENFVSSCEVIIHLAAINRHVDEQNLFEVNIELVKTLLDACRHAKVRPHIIISSSIQEGVSSVYGESKYMGRKLIEEWTQEKDAGTMCGLLIPNVFGPFCKPNYNSVVATFCHNIINGIPTKVIDDSMVNFIYVNDLVNIIIDNVRNRDNNTCYLVEPTSSIKVSELLQKLCKFNDEYINRGIIPVLSNKFCLDLFNTFRSYIDIHGFFPVRYLQNVDERGTFVELIRLSSGGQVSFSSTKPGISRGNHYHTRKIERFSVIKGTALIQLRRVGCDQILNFVVSGTEPCYIDMPIWYTHNIKNIGEGELLTIFWINEFFDSNDPDTFYEDVNNYLK